MSDSPPANPAGPFELVEEYCEDVRSQLTETIAQAPQRHRDVVAGLSDEQLDTRYKNWTARQITHHLADSHLHILLRFKWTLTESTPTIKAYEEADWVELADSRLGAVEPALAMLDGVHTKWVQVLELMTVEQFARAFRHPQTGATVSLWWALNNYAWHGRHHTAQIQWLRDQHGWS